MAFVVERVVPQSPQQVWDRVADLASHTEFVPLTRSGEVEGGVRLGAEFVARTGVGPLGFDDRMLITRWEPPRVLRIVKTGRLLSGWAQIEVLPEGSGARVRWSEELWLRGARRVSVGVADRLGPRLFGPVLAGLLGESG